MPMTELNIKNSKLFPHFNVLRIKKIIISWEFFFCKRGKKIGRDKLYVRSFYYYVSLISMSSNWYSMFGWQIEEFLKYIE